jgi:thiol-disulfide isomerase/thioredoxin
MTRRSPLLTLIATTAIIAAACTPSPAQPLPDLGDLPGASTNQGEVAADFTVPTFDGATWHGPAFTLSEHLADDGRPVFLNLWASWCGPCRAEMPDIDAAAARHPEVQFVGVAVKDDRGAAREFAIEIGVGYLLAFDEGDVVDDGYLPFGLPATYFISADGDILEQIFGPLTGEQIDEKLAAHFGTEES